MKEPKETTRSQRKQQYQLQLRFQAEPDETIRVVVQKKTRKPNHRQLPLRVASTPTIQLEPSCKFRHQHVREPSNCALPPAKHRNAFSGTGTKNIWFRRNSSGITRQDPPNSSSRPRRYADRYKAPAVRELFWPVLSWQKVQILEIMPRSGSDSSVPPILPTSLLLMMCTHSQPQIAVIRLEDRWYCSGDLFCPAKRRGNHIFRLLLSCVDLANGAGSGICSWSGPLRFPYPQFFFLRTLNSYWR